MVEWFKFFGQAHFGSDYNLVSCLEHIVAAYARYWGGGSRYGCRQVNDNSNQTLVDIYGILHLLKILRQAIICATLNCSCLPTWSEDDRNAIAYIAFLCISGGLIPTMVMIISSVVVLYKLKKVLLKLIFQWLEIKLIE